MKVISQKIPDVKIFEPIIFGDDRGYFTETFRKDIFEEAVGYKINFVQDNESSSSKGILRGLHYQISPYSQAKLVRVIEGKVLDICLDIRKSSSTFGEYVAVELSSENKYQLFVPHGFAHGFVVLSEKAIFSYKVDSYYAPNFERGIAFDDQDLSIDWQLPKESLILSDKDKSHPSLADSKDLFE